MIATLHLMNGERQILASGYSVEQNVIYLLNEGHVCLNRSAIAERECRVHNSSLCAPGTHIELRKFQTL
jgi:hypothetical protein